MIKCTKCGRENADEAKFCIKCGEELHREEEVEKRFYPKTGRNKSKDKEKSRNLGEEEKLEIEKYAEEHLGNKRSFTAACFWGASGIFFILGAICFLFFWPLGIFFVLIGFINRAIAKSVDKETEGEYKNKKEHLIRELKLKALKGQNWRKT